jgi:predicted thioesterase
MPDIEIGLTGTAEMIVEKQDLASLFGNIGAEVLSTPRVVQLMEHAA